MSAATRWVGGVIALLVGNALAVAALIGAAGGDTGRRVVPDYYQKAAAWDDVMAASARTARLGWRCQVTARGRTVAVACRDDADRPVGASATITALPRGRADEAVAVTMEPADGGFRGVVSGGRHGLHDLTVVVLRGDDRWSGSALVELSSPVPPTGAPP